MLKSNRNWILWLVATGFTLYVLSRPQCKRGCQTVLQHLLMHELDMLV